MKALKIRVDWETGKRAGNINVREFPYPAIYQDLEGEYEIRLVPDEVAERYRNVEGITILEGKQILDELERMIKPRYVIPAGFEGIVIKDIEDKMTGNIVFIGCYDKVVKEVELGDDLLEFLYEAGVIGIRKIIPFEPRIRKLLKEMVDKGIITQAEADGFMKRIKAKKRNHPVVVEMLKKLLGKLGIFTL